MFFIKLVKTTNPRKIPKILRKKSKPVKKITRRTLKLIEKMKKIMIENNGIGLAAPQVGKLLQIIIVGTSLENCIALINPEVIYTSSETEELEEGCLSFPGYFAKIKRPFKVEVKGLNEKGKPVEIRTEGILARAFLHEIDHLHGKLFIDYLENLDELKKIQLA